MPSTQTAAETIPPRPAEAIGGRAFMQRIATLPPAERVTAMAYQRSLLNVGFGLGAAISGLVLAVDPACCPAGENDARC